jgi:uncharacterized membrane protein YfcA
VPKFPFPADEREEFSGLKPPQFGLSAFLILVAVIAAAVFALRTAGPLMAAAVILLFLAVFAHVAANALGTRLRDNRKHLPRDPTATDSTRIAEPHHFAPATRLRHRHKLGWPVILLSAAGALAGAIIGGRLLAQLNAEQITMANLTIAVLSSAILGGLAGFLSFSFAKVFLQALWQAHRDSDSR